MEKQPPSSCRDRVALVRSELRLIADRSENKVVARLLRAIASCTPGTGVLFTRLNSPAMRLWLAELADDIHAVDVSSAEALLSLAESLPSGNDEEKTT